MRIITTALASAALLAVSIPTTAWPMKPEMMQQRPILSSVPFPANTGFHHSSAHFDAAPNSVGLLLTSPNEDEVQHFWLPLGQKVYIRDAPLLPLHPTTARITTLIRSSPELATPERLEAVECLIYAVVNETTATEKRLEAMFGRRRGRARRIVASSVGFSKSDGLVRLAEAESPLFLGGAEVEAFECR